MKTKTIIGILLIVAGAWKLANLWGIIENDWLWHQPWTAYVAPVLLLWVGATIIVDSYRRDPDQWLQRPLPFGEDGKRICCSVHYGGDEYVYRGEAFHGARLDAFCGGIELFVPTNVNVVVQSRSFIGGVGNHTTHTADPKAPTIHIVASNFFGGVDVKN